MLTTKDVRTVQRVISDAGLLPLSKKGRVAYFHSTDALKAIYRSGESAKERLDVARAEIAELDLAERRGEVLPAVQVGEGQAKRETRVRARFLAMPSNLAGQIAPPGKIQQVEALLTTAIHEALAELAGDADSVGS